MQIRVGRLVLFKAGGFRGVIVSHMEPLVRLEMQGEIRLGKDADPNMSRRGGMVYWEGTTKELLEKAHEIRRAP